MKYIMNAVSSLSVSLCLCVSLSLSPSPPRWGPLPSLPPPTPSTVEVNQKSGGLARGLSPQLRVLAALQRT